MTTRYYARIVRAWVERAGLDPSAYGTHSMGRTKASMIYHKTGNLRAVQLLLGHTNLESTVRYLGQSLGGQEWASISACSGASAAAQAPTWSTYDAASGTPSGLHGDPSASAGTDIDALKTEVACTFEQIVRRPQMPCGVRANAGCTGDGTLGRRKRDHGSRS